MEKNPKNLQTKIECVIVYQKGVQITQVGKIDLSKGEQLLSIGHLPETIDKESFRVKGIGEGKIINISVEFNSEKKYRKIEYQKLKEEQEKIEKEVKLNEIKSHQIIDQIEKFKVAENNFYNDFAKAYAFGEADLSKFFEFDSEINENLKSKTDAAETLEERIRELSIELQVINNKISQLGSLEEVHNFYDIIINLNVIKEGEFTIELRYTMSQAWWIPFYDIILSEDEGNLTMMANVYNRTGQDWENVQMEISTASLKPIILKKPNPIVLEEIIPYDYEKNLKGKPMGTSFRGLSKHTTSELKDEAGYYDQAAMAGEMEEKHAYPEEPEPEIEATYAELTENIGVQSFKIPSLLTIPSDKNPHPVNLTVQLLETKKKYFWSSAAPEHVIIRDELINGDILLLAGNVKIYFAEEFIGETIIPVIAPKERFKLGTRISYDLKVEKKIIDRSKDKKAIKGRLKNNYTYTIIIKNLKNVSEDLTLYDKIPHSSSEYIKVEFQSIDPEPDKRELGILKWKFNLKGVAEKIIQYKYYVEYKKGIQITPPLP